ncbi:hypothetical protein [Neptunomonas phycophila]|uniref:hypothetical protein n=1 Tax=Neptunomonas phycophila TaxID=1572645 RepID=UPI0015C1BC06|nr:hypothetical protein [Neptunomonas phycophila]QLE96776.1 hypothetical protein FLM49_03635 [Neptunomonas phycophila]
MLSEREILIHVGLPKTATTTIQDTMHLNSKLLLEKYSIDYCVDLCDLLDVKCTGHHPMAWSAFHRNHPHAKPIDSNLIKKRLSQSKKVFLSSEWFLWAKEDKLKKIVGDWGLPSNRKVLLVVRNEKDYVRSNWLQSVKMGHTFLSF